MKKLISLFILTLLAANVHAISLQDLQVKDLDKTFNSEYRDYNDSSLMKIRYTGAETTAQVYFSTGACFIEAPAGTVIMSTISFASTLYDTIGEVCDYIEAQDDLECDLTGGKRNDDSDYTWNDNTVDDITGGGYEVIIGTKAADTSAVEAGSYMLRMGITPESGKSVALKYCTVNLNSTTSDTNGFIVYGKLSKYATASDGITRNDTTTVISGITITDDTDTNVGNLYDGYWMKFAKDAHVVISAGSGTSTQASGNFLTCYWDEI